MRVGPFAPPRSAKGPTSIERIESAAQIWGGGCTPAVCSASARQHLARKPIGWNEVRMSASEADHPARSANPIPQVLRTMVT